MWVSVSKIAVKLIKGRRISTESNSIIKRNEFPTFADFASIFDVSVEKDSDSYLAVDTEAEMPLRLAKRVISVL